MAINRDLLNATLDVIRQSLQTDGGDVELIDVSDDGTVTLEMTGSCAGCPMSAYDMSEGLDHIPKDSQGCQHRSGRPRSKYECPDFF